MIKVAIPVIDQEEIDAAIKVLKTGNYTSGPIVEQFEKEFAKYIGTEYAVACNSGTAALHMALLSLGIGPGDEVIVPAMSFFATVSAVMMTGAQPVFCDVDGYANMYCNNLSHHITQKTKAIIPVHYFGMPCEIEAILDVAKRYNLFVIEDCAQAHGALVGTKKVGSFGIANCFSFFATKNMTTVEGGMVTTDDKYIYEQCKLLRSHGMVDRDNHVILGYNYRLNEVFAAIGRKQLSKLDDLNDRRITNSKFLQSEIKAPGIRRLYLDEDVFNSNKKCVYFWFPVVASSVTHARIFINNLKQNGIEVRYRYETPLYNQPIFKRKYDDVSLQNSIRLSGCVIGLPNHPLLTKQELEKIVNVVNEGYK